MDHTIVKWLRSAVVTWCVFLVGGICRALCESIGECFELLGGNRLDLFEDSEEDTFGARGCREAAFIRPVIIKIQLAGHKLFEVGLLLGTCVHRAE